MDRTDLVTKLTLAWKRALLPYLDDVYCMYLEEGLTGWVYIIDKPTIGEFGGNKCILVPLYVWMMLKQLAANTVTPFRIVTQGATIVSGAWQPHTGLKYPVRNDKMGPATVFIPVSEFKPVDA